MLKWEYIRYWREKRSAIYKGISRSTTVIIVVVKREIDTNKISVFSES